MFTLEEKQTKVFAVDGDTIAYRTAAVCEDHFEGAAEAIINSTLAEIATETGITKMRIYLSGEDNFRYKIGKTKPYKGNRATMVRPRFLKHCMKFLVEEYRAIKCHGYEADDAIATDMVLNGAIHCGVDKDILQIPGHHYNYVKKEWQEVSEEDAITTLYKQILMGDASDNVPGLPGVGVATAAKVITDHFTARDDALAFYEEICAKKLPDIDHNEYFFEQEALVSMVTNVNLFDLLTMTVQPNTEGFEEQEGSFTEVEKEEPKL